MNNKPNPELPQGVLLSGTNSFLKKDSAVIIGPKSVFKKLSQYEKSSYLTLEPHLAALEENHVKIPKIISFDQESGFHELTKLSGFRLNDIYQHFGTGLNYFPEELLVIFKGLSLLRNVVPTSGLNNQIDHDSNIADQKSLLRNDLSKSDPEFVPLAIETVKFIEKTQDTITQLPTEFAHRDFNVSNVVVFEDSLHVVDFESMGVAKPGYDEARFALTTVLNANLLISFIDTFVNTHTEAESIYFFRTLAIRCFRTHIAL